jgi:mannose-6-phosphate isomerase-like protein (cupin superfamily)
MKITRSAAARIDFDGLEIHDYTADLEVSSSIAEISVSPGVRHRPSWSRRSDKYYYLIEGRLSFVLGEEQLELAAGDCCIVRQGDRFSYHNPTHERTRLLLVHTPRFDLAAEVFEEAPD